MELQVPEGEHVSEQEEDNWSRWVTKLLLVSCFLLLTNPTVLDRVFLLLTQQRLTTLGIYLALLGMTFGAVLIVAFLPGLKSRIFWSLLILTSTALGTGFSAVSGGTLSTFDFMVIWSSLTMTDQAMSSYGTHFVWPALLVGLGAVALLIPPRPPAWLARSLPWVQWAPLAPVAAIVGIVHLFEGGGTDGLPVQSSPAAVAAAVIVDDYFAAFPPREQVELTSADEKRVRNVVLLVDESIRGDHVDLSAPDPIVPYLASQRNTVADFGIAASGNNCSSYSNALLRMGASQRGLATDVHTNPLIWDYAQSAGYRTVFLDAQGAITSGGEVLTNFFTPHEVSKLDRFITLREHPTNWDRDQIVAGLLRELLAEPGPQFIYVNKNGAHIPYEESYPEEETIWNPTMTGTSLGDASTVQVRNSYRNAVRWSVDRFFETLLTDLDMSETVILYTSDHGQNLPPWGRTQATHCTTDNPDAEEGRVPLLAITARTDLQTALRNGARINHDEASHFAIYPTLLTLMGYDAAEVRARHGATLLDRITERQAFTSGDVFSRFGSQLRWTDLDASDTEPRITQEVHPRIADPTDQTKG